jgi:hypothetical protein
MEAVGRAPAGVVVRRARARAVTVRVVASVAVVAPEAPVAEGKAVAGVKAAAVAGTKVPWAPASASSSS